MAGELKHASVGTVLSQAEYEDAAAHVVVWADFTPTMTQGVGLTITVNYARYCLIGKTAVVQINITINSAGTAGQHIIIASIPAAIAPRDAGAYSIMGSGLYFDSGAVFYQLAVVPGSASTLKFLGYNVADVIGVSPAVTAASGDVISAALAYEVA